MFANQRVVPRSQIIADQSTASHLPPVYYKRVLSSNNAVGNGRFRPGDQTPSHRAKGLVEPPSILDLREIDDTVRLDLDILLVQRPHQDVELRLGHWSRRDAMVAVLPVDVDVAACRTHRGQGGSDGLGFVFRGGRGIGLDDDRAILSGRLGRYLHGLRRASDWPPISHEARRRHARGRIRTVVAVTCGASAIAGFAVPVARTPIAGAFVAGGGVVGGIGTRQRGDGAVCCPVGGGAQGSAGAKRKHDAPALEKVGGHKKEGRKERAGGGTKLLSMALGLEKMVDHDSYEFLRTAALPDRAGICSGPTWTLI